MWAWRSRHVQRTLLTRRKRWYAPRIRSSARSSPTWTSALPLVPPGGHEGDDHGRSDHEGDVETVDESGLARPVRLGGEPVEVVLRPPRDKQPHDRQVREGSEPRRAPQLGHDRTAEEQEHQAQAERKTFAEIKSKEEAGPRLRYPRKIRGV